MSTRALQRFGGDWTQEKLALLRKYLAAYATIMRKRQYRFAYIDAFAGTGYRETKGTIAETACMFPDLAGKEPQGFLDGSARIALQIDPPFDKYIFIEATGKRCQELGKLREEFPEKAARIESIQADCNAWLQERCLRYSWKSNRAALFLDPFGMQVEWATMEAIAKTQAIDVLILFPVGVAVNRLLRKDGEIEDRGRAALDRLFGTSDWYQEFYRERTAPGLFGLTKKTHKVGNFESITHFYVERLKTIFAKDGVAEKPRPLCNSKGNPLFHLCFATGNPAAAKTAVKIANHILKG